MTADLHVHTNFSDGALSPEEIVKLAKEKNLGTIAITDHDVVDGIELALIESAKSKVRIIPGIEFTCEVDEAELHILGYFINYKKEGLLAVLKKLQQSRHDRIGLIIKQLSKDGIPLDESRIRAIAGQGSAGRPHVAQGLIEAGYAANTKEAFMRYLIPGKPGYAPHYKLHPLEALKLIHESGGVSVYAHPRISNYDEIIPKLAENGLSGIEVYYPSHGYADERHYLEVAQKHNLVVTGGSDFHGGRGINEVQLGEKFVPDENVAELEKRKK